MNIDKKIKKIKLQLLADDQLTNICIKESVLCYDAITLTGIIKRNGQSIFHVISAKRYIDDIMKDIRLEISESDL